jgi:hypothetical protein|tara:strand:- start:24052 stop:24972 length:921 start_codon:yes stop_codon:yes gene_type:complete
MAYIDQKKYYTNDGATPNDANWGSYQYVSLKDVVTNFLLMYQGNHALINNVNRFKILFHAKRGIQELNYDAFKIIKSLQLTIYDDLKFVLPPDFVNWVKLSLFKDNVIRDLVENIQVQSATSFVQSGSSTFTYDADDNVNTQTSGLDTARTNGSLESIYLRNLNDENANPGLNNLDNDIYDSRIGARYGLNTETANVNPTFTVDRKAGVINFDSTMANEQCILQYISDGLENGNDDAVSVNKLFEEYIYAYIKYALLNNKFGVQEYIVNRARKDKTALLRNAKIRLSNIHPSRLLMNLRGENKWIK